MAWTETRWTTWTPTITQGVNVTKTITFARYCVIGNMVALEAVMSITSAGTAGSSIDIGGLPVAVRPVNAVSNVHIIGIMNLSDASAGIHFIGGLVYAAADVMRAIRDNTGVFIGSGVTLASGDILGISAHYEI